MDEAHVNEIVNFSKNKLKEKGIFEESYEYIFEPVIRFPPTYKMIHKGFSYLLNDTYIPSFPDRIFCLKPLIFTSFEIENKSYECSFVTNKSDHKPVYAQYSVKEKF